MSALQRGDLWLEEPGSQGPGRADALWNEGVIDKLQKWAADQQAVRAVLLTSNRAAPPGSHDALSDFDVVLVVCDVHPFHADRAWIGDFGDVLVTYWDALYADKDSGVEIFANVVQYESGLRIDFTLWPVDKARRIGEASQLPAGLDCGYLALVDKDDLTTDFKAPSYTAFAPTRPSAADFARFVEEFYSDAPAVAKYLMRGDLLPAKWVLDHDMKQIYLRRLLEWQIALDTDWNVQFRSLGKGLRRRTSVDRWQQLEAGYAGSDIDDNWRALDATLDVFRDVGEDVAHRLGFVYPVELHQRVCEFLVRYRREGESALANAMQAGEFPNAYQIMTKPQSDNSFTGNVAKFYDSTLVPLIFEGYAEDLAARANTLEPGTVLEVACGTGVVTRALARTLPSTARSPLPT